MTKPIFVIKVPRDVFCDIRNFIENIRKAVGEDYAVILVMHDSSNFEFESHYNITEAESHEIIENIKQKANEEIIKTFGSSCSFIN